MSIDELEAMIPGYQVALVLKRPVKDLSCYVGEVQVVDERGVRVTLVDWLTGAFTSWDFFVPWDNIEAVLIGTPAHDLSGFIDYAERFQKAVAPEEHA